MPARAVQVAAALAVALAAMAMTLKGSGQHSAIKTNRTNANVFECTKLGVGSRCLASYMSGQMTGTVCSVLCLLAAKLSKTFWAEFIVVCRYTVVESTEDTKGDRLTIRELVRAGSPGMSSIWHCTFSVRSTDVCHLYTLLGQYLQLARTAWWRATVGMQASPQGEVARHLHTFTKRNRNASLFTVAGAPCVATHVMHTCTSRNVHTHLATIGLHWRSFSYVIDDVIGHLKPGDAPACIPAGQLCFHIS